MDFITLFFLYLKRWKFKKKKRNRVTNVFWKYRSIDNIGLYEIRLNVIMRRSLWQAFSEHEIFLKYERQHIQLYIGGSCSIALEIQTKVYGFMCCWLYLFILKSGFLIFYYCRSLSVVNIL